MNARDVEAGFFYHNGKEGVRQVVSVDAGRVEYLILAARQEREWSLPDGRMVSVIGQTKSCLVESFVSWASEKLNPTSGTKLLLELQAGKIKLTDRELSFLRSLEDEAGGDILPDTVFYFERSNGRTVAGLAQKGLVIRRELEADVTPLGAAWFRCSEKARLTS